LAWKLSSLAAILATRLPIEKALAITAHTATEPEHYAVCCNAQLSVGMKRVGIAAYSVQNRCCTSCSGDRQTWPRSGRHRTRKAPLAQTGKHLLGLSFTAFDPRRISKLTSFDCKPHLRREGHQN
jgi:hypothetical protein